VFVRCQYQVPFIVTPVILVSTTLPTADRALQLSAHDSADHRNQL
jgi:hypothetical protein